MSEKPKYPAAEKLFQKIPIGQFFKEHGGQLPKKLPKKVREKMLKDIEFFSEIGTTVDDPTESLKEQLSNKNALKRMKNNVKAYPNYDDYIDSSPPRNTQKWIQAVKDIYFQVYQGNSKEKAIEHITAKWNDMEKFDFENWLKFYESDGHKKYNVKTSQLKLWEGSDTPGYFLPLVQQNAEDEPLPSTIPREESTPQTLRSPGAQSPQWSAEEPIPPTLRSPSQESAQGSYGLDVSPAEKRSIIERQRQKIIGRLDSIEKLLRSQEGQLFVGREFERLLEAVHQLKRKIHMVNKISVSTRLYEDMIIREANILSKGGFIKSAELLQRVAQIPSVPEAPNPTDMGGELGGWPAIGPGNDPVGNQAPNMPSAKTKDLNAPAPPLPPPEEPKKEEEAGMEEFLDGLNTSNLTVEEELSTEDSLEVYDDEDLVVEAQEAPPAAPQQEAEEAPTATPAEVKTEKNIDTVIDTAFANVTIPDVISKLEDLSQIFKNREIPRQLAMVDMMLDRLGLASFFPTLAEAATKALESNQYISSRVDDILGRLRGTMEARQIDLKSDQAATPTPELTGARDKLQTDMEKEKARKKMRKELADQALTKQQPELEVGPELEQATPAPAAPPAPTPAPARTP